MKKRFITKKRRTHKKRIVFFFLAFFLLFGYFSSRMVSKVSLKGSHEELLSILLSHGNRFMKDTSKKEKNLLTKTVSYLLQVDLKKPSTLLATNYQSVWKDADIKEPEQIDKKVEAKEKLQNKDPQIYIYNTHQKEEYKPSSFLEYSVSPNVMLASYILKEHFDKKGYPSLVEERSVQDEVSRLGQKYYYSYRVSRSFMEDAKINNPTLTYFIDVHRDSVSREITYLEKDGKGYAKILFIVGLENPNYQENYAFTKKIFDVMESKVPGITRTIYEKQGEGVDGVYNQDFSPYTILVEIGGEENTVDEVYNTTLVLAEAYLAVISS